MKKRVVVTLTLLAPSASVTQAEESFWQKQQKVVEETASDIADDAKEVAGKVADKTKEISEKIGDEASDAGSSLRDSMRKTTDDIIEKLK